MVEAIQQEKGGAGRGKAYPFISLETALERAYQLLEKEKRSKFPFTSAFADWGYALKSSGGRQTLAALNYFGLVDYVSKGEARLSELALNILLDRRPDSEEKLDLLRQAALNPPIHSDIRTKFGFDLPSDTTIQTFLEKDCHYTERGAKELISEYKDTIRFAKLDQPDKKPSGDSPKPDFIMDTLNQFFPEQGKKNPPPPIGEQDQFAMPGGIVLVRWPQEMSAEVYAEFEAWLTLAKLKAKRLSKSE